MTGKSFSKVQQIVGDKVFSVSEFLDFLNGVISPLRVIVEGEIGEKIGKYPRFTFFSLLDKDASLLNCFSWANIVNGLGIAFEPGMEIRIFGYPTVYKKNGQMSFQVLRIELKGEGALRKQFQFLKKELKRAGYFREDHKKPIPRFCENVGLITSKQARGAKKDFLTNLDNFGFNVSFYGVLQKPLLGLMKTGQIWTSWF